MIEAARGQAVGSKALAAQGDTVLDELATHLKTDMEAWEVLKLSQLLQKFDTQNIITKVMDDSPDGLLYATNINGSYYLVPKGDNYSAIQNIANNIFNSDETISASSGFSSGRPPNTSQRWFRIAETDQSFCTAPSRYISASGHSTAA